MKNNFLNIAKKCLEQNKLLVKKNLVIQNFGNVSIRLDEDFFVIKPSGINLEKVKASNFPLINIKNGKCIKGKLKPSSDTETHLEIYKKYKDIKSITHTHSTFAISWAQAGKSIPILGTTHADFWEKEIPIANYISKKNIEKNYEKYTGKLIVETMIKKKLNPHSCPGIIVIGHGPFTWSRELEGSVKNAEALEFIAKTSYFSEQLKIKKKFPKYISNKHFQRKHGKKAYYGQ